MTEEQIRLALALLVARKDIRAHTGASGDYSYDKIGAVVGVSGEAIRLLDQRDMSAIARNARKMAQYTSASHLSRMEELIAAGWVVCFDLLRLNTSVEAFAEFLSTGSLLSVINSMPAFFKCGLIVFVNALKSDAHNSWITT